MKTLLPHAPQSTPNGLKPTIPRPHRPQSHLPDDDFGAALRIVQAEFEQDELDGVGGSSRGGAVAMDIDSGNIPVVLLIAAWKTHGDKAIDNICWKGIVPS